MAYCAFINNVENSIHFMNPAFAFKDVCSLSLPCATRLWEARTSIEWELEMTKSNIYQRPVNLKAAVRILLGGRQNPANQVAHIDFEYDPFSMQILIHCVTSAVVELNQTTPSSSSDAVRLLKSADFKAALTIWRRYFNKMNTGDQQGGMALSALRCYHFAYILIDVDVNGIVEAAGLRCSEDDAMSPERNEIAQPHTSGQEVYVHLLEILRICLDDRNGESQPPLYTGYTEFLALLIFQTQVEELEKNQDQQQDLSRDSTSNFDDMSGIEIIRDLIEMENIRSVSTPPNLMAIKKGLYCTIQAVRDRLVETSWELGTLCGTCLDKQN